MSRNTAHCYYELIDGDIHTFTLLQNSERAINEWLSTMSELYDALLDGLGGDLSKHDGPIHILIRVKPRIVPLGYLLYAYNRWEKRHPQRLNAHVAVLYRAGMLIPILGRITSVVRSTDMIRFFGDNEREEAVKWLRTTD